MSENADSLLAALVGRNVDDLAFTNRAIQESISKDAQLMAQVFLRLFDAADCVQVIDRRLLAAQEDVRWLIPLAERLASPVCS